MEGFEAYRDRLLGAAYRMLGSRAEAEDVVQEAYLRWHQADREAIRNPEAWLVTAVTRLAIDRLRALLGLFAPDAAWTADGGGRVPASRRVIVGAERIARLLLGLGKSFYRGEVTREVVTINGEAGLVVRVDGRIRSTISIATDGERILAGYTVVNPDKLPRPFPDGRLGRGTELEQPAAGESGPPPGMENGKT
ncbi:MAG TPA: sigma factor [Thermodesulfobacteriota bacterium]